LYNKLILVFGGNECGKCDRECLFYELSDKGYEDEKWSLEIDVKSFNSLLSELPYECIEVLSEKGEKPRPLLEEDLYRLIDCLYRSEWKKKLLQLLQLLIVTALAKSEVLEIMWLVIHPP
jgi:integrase